MLIQTLKVHQSTKEGSNQRGGFQKLLLANEPTSAVSEREREKSPLKARKKKKKKSGGREVPLRGVVTNVYPDAEGAKGVEAHSMALEGSNHDRVIHNSGHP